MLSSNNDREQVLHLLEWATLFLPAKNETHGLRRREEKSDFDGNVMPHASWR